MDFSKFLDLLGLTASRGQDASGDDEPVAYVHVRPSAAQTAEFERALRSILVRKQQAAAGEIQFIGLSDVKARLEARWPELETRVHKVANQTIENSLGENDIFARYDDLTYILVFAELDKDAAAVKCAQIAEAIQRSLFGDDDMQTVHIRSLVGVIDDHLLFEDRTLAQCLGAMAARIEQAALQPAAAAPAATNGQTSVQAAGLDAVAHRQPLKDDAEPAASVGAGGPPLKFLYLPAWNARKEAVSAYRCVPARDTDDGLELGYRAVYAGRRPEPVDEVDLHALDHVLGIVPRMLADKAQFLTLISVHYNTLAEIKTRRAYLEASARISADIKRYMMVEIFGAPPSVPASRHTELVSALHAHFAAVLIRASLHGEHFQRGAGMSQFDGFTVGVRGAPGGIESLHWALHRFAHQAQGYHGTSCALDLDTPSVVQAAIGAGFTYVDGPAVLPPVAMPAHVYRLPKDKLAACA